MFPGPYVFVRFAKGIDFNHCWVGSLFLSTTVSSYFLLLRPGQMALVWPWASGGSDQGETELGVHSAYTQWGFMVCCHSVKGKPLLVLLQGPLTGTAPRG